MTTRNTLGAITLAAAVSMTATVALHVHATPAEASTPISHSLSTAHKPDFAAIKDVATKKSRFFAYLSPAINQVNAGIEHDRTQLISQFHSSTPFATTSFLTTMANQYQLPIPPSGVDKAWQQAILKRVDIIPAPLVMSQAAIESGWGTSRFAVKGNNYFGQWCYTKGCGIFPHEETSGSYHEVKRFGSTTDAIQAYFTNVNTNPAYQALRDIRAQRRVDGLPLTADALAPGLIDYSQIGEKYVNEIRAMIRDDSQYMTAPSHSS
ncbi:glucosaminidase domain-containing protein [Photobacterium nomapromontoriensis]|uniref:glucosaminidase domain-containing protein n=1 Tax=Photobacterium nomapromontoriensis TaxID=2910237 RepID=UPI003D0D52CB